MAELSSGVYDEFHPATPISLKELSAIAISLEIWRCKLNSRQNRKLNSACSPLKERLPLNSILTDLGIPSSIHKTIEEYLSQFTFSLEPWLFRHHKNAFFRYKNQNDVLGHFDNFACDYDGNIDYVRTAERMIYCDRFNEEEKFIIACVYCFEDDIVRIWPSVSSKMHLSRRTFERVKSKKVHLDALEFDDCPLLYYWICRLTNQLDKIQTKPNSTIDETMFHACCHHTEFGSSMVYFWNRIPSSNRLAKTVEAFIQNRGSVARFILPIMDHQLLREFVFKRSGWVMDLCNPLCGKRFSIRTWFLYIRNIVNGYGFSLIIEELLIKDDDDTYYQLVNRQYVRRVVWNSAPLDLKRSVIRNISPGMLEDQMVEETSHYDDDDDVDHDYSLRINVEFLLIVLQYATLEERTAFWLNCWHTVILLIPGEDVQHLQRIIKQCIEDDDEISRFKRNVLTKSDLVRKKCVLYLTNGDLNVLNEFVNFCFPELQRARIFKQQLLQFAFFDQSCPLNSNIVLDQDVFNEFIDEAYQDADFSTGFKNQLMSSPLNQLRLCELTCSGEVPLEKLIKFIHRFGAMEQTLSQIQMCMRDYLKTPFGRTRSCNHINRMGSRYLPISSWCSEQNEEAEAPSSVNPKKWKK